MHAMIRQGDGRYYISAVFGYYRDIDETETDDYKRYLQEIYKPYWIVWDEKKKRLIRWLNMAPNTEYLSLQILIVDADQSNWITDAQGVGCVDFLSRDLLDSFLDEEQQPEDRHDQQDRLAHREGHRNDDHYRFLRSDGYVCCRQRLLYFDGQQGIGFTGLE